MQKIENANMNRIDEFKLKWLIAKEILNEKFSFDIEEAYIDNVNDHIVLRNDVTTFYSSNVVYQTDPEDTLGFYLNSGSHWIAIHLKDLAMKDKKIFLEKFLCKDLWWCQVKCSMHFTIGKDGNYLNAFKSSSIDDACKQIGKVKEEILIENDLKFGIYIV